MIGEIHHVRGRLRLRTLELKRNPERARAVSKALELERGIRSVEANVLTGSLLVYYDPKVLDGDAVLDILGVEPARTQVGRIGDEIFWWAVEKVVERAVPALIGALL